MKMAQTIRDGRNGREEAQETQEQNALLQLHPPAAGILGRTFNHGLHGLTRIRSDRFSIRVIRTAIRQSRAFPQRLSEEYLSREWEGEFAIIPLTIIPMTVPAFSQPQSPPAVVAAQRPGLFTACRGCSVNVNSTGKP